MHLYSSIVKLQIDSIKVKKKKKTWAAFSDDFYHISVQQSYRCIEGKGRR